MGKRYTTLEHVASEHKECCPTKQYHEFFKYPFDVRVWYNGKVDAYRVDRMYIYVKGKLRARPMKEPIYRERG